MKSLILTASFLVPLLTAGCNAVYFYETDKISLSVETRPDATGPIQGNFGLKQRVVAFVPKRNGDPVSPTVTATQQAAANMDTASKALQDAAQNPEKLKKDPAARQELKRQLVKALDEVSDSDAMSVLSALRFHKLPKPDGAPFYKISHMTIDSALITGNAAKIVARPGEAIAALSGHLTLGGINRVIALRRIYSTLKTASKDDATSADLVRSLDSMANNLLPDTYPVRVYSLSTPSGDLNTEHLSGDKVTPRATFDNLLNYLAELQASADLLDHIPSHDFAIDGVTATPVNRAEFPGTLSKTKAEIDRVTSTLGEQSSIKKSVQYFLGAF